MPDDVIARGLGRLGVAANAEQLDQLAAYLAELRHWNRAYNLVAPGDVDHLETRHLLDALSILPHLGDGELLDVGTGAGFPGLPLAILRPGMAVTLLDSAGKKVRFLRHVVRRLGLDNVHPVQARVERFTRTPAYRTITARAFASLQDFVEAVRHLAGPGTQLLAMKGRHPELELAELPSGITLDAVHRLDVPGLDADRHLVRMTVSAD